MLLARLLSKAALSSILSGDISEGSTLLEELQRSLSGEMPRYVTSRTCLILSQLRWHSGRYAEALDAAERAVAQSTSGPAVERAHALEMIALACHSLGAWQRGLEAELARQALEIEDGFDVDEAFEGHACLWEYHLYGDLPYPDVEVLVRKALRQAERSGNRRAMALTLLALGSVLFLVGRWHDSEDTFERSIDLAGVVGAEMLAIHGHQRLALLESASGRIEVALLRLVSAIGRAEGSSSAQVWHHSRSRLYATLARDRLQAGAADAAADAVDLAEAVRRDAGACLTCDALLHPVSVPVRLAIGDIGAARSSAQNATESGDIFRSGGWRAAAAYARGLVSMREGELLGAIRELEAARRTFAVLGQPYDEARSLEAIAAAQRDVGVKGHHRFQAASRRASILHGRLGAVADSDALARAQMSGKAGRRPVS